MALMNTALVGRVTCPSAATAAPQIGPGIPVPGAFFRGILQDTWIRRTGNPLVATVVPGFPELGWAGWPGWALRWPHRVVIPYPAGQRGT